MNAAAPGLGLPLGRRRFVALHLRAGVSVVPGGGFVPVRGGLNVMLTARGRTRRIERISLAWFREVLKD